MNLPKLTDIDVSGKRVLVRMDLDVDNDFTRIELAKDTLRYLKDKGCRIIVIGHKGRPDGKVVPELSLRRLTDVIAGISETEATFCEEVVGESVRSQVDNLQGGKVLLLENLRFDPGEENNYPEFVQKLASMGDFYVNESFAVSHRGHASFVGLPTLLPHAAGFRLLAEVEMLSRVIENPRRPVVAVISGVKKDKLERIAEMLDIADKVLIGGRLPIYLEKDNPENLRSVFSSASKDAISKIQKNDKVFVANLIADTFDISLNSVQKFKDEILKAGTIILAGVPGKYEEEGYRQGTKEVFEAIADSDAYKVAGGGDAEAAITLLRLNDKFDWISVGGGAMLEFLAKGTLPGIEALRL